MTDYNDGKWHGWNGGECPVHPESVVSIVLENGSVYHNQRADDWDFSNGEDCLPIIGFRVTRPYVKPREWCVCWDDGEEFCKVVYDGRPTSIWNNIVHVREVLE